MHSKDSFLQEAYHEGLNFRKNDIPLRYVLDYFKAFGEGGYFLLAFDEQDGPFSSFEAAYEAARQQGLKEFEIEHRPTKAEMLEAFEAGLRDAR